MNRLLENCGPILGRAPIAAHLLEIYVSEIECCAMYRISKEKKDDPVRRWNLPDRVFFACGACHILAYAFLEKYPDTGAEALWIKPASGFSGNHIVGI